MPPTFEEIKDHFDLSAVSTVHQHIEALVAKGLLTKESNVSRGLQFKQLELSYIEVPLSGTIAAGYPIEAMEENETIAVASPLIKKGTRYYALRVKGNSMVKEHIRDG